MFVCRSIAAATTMTIVQGVQLQQGVGRNDRSKYSCANPFVEIAERIARIVFIVSNKPIFLPVTHNVWPLYH